MWTRPAHRPGLPAAQHSRACAGRGRPAHRVPGQPPRFLGLVTLLRWRRACGAHFRTTALAPYLGSARRVLLSASLPCGPFVRLRCKDVGPGRAGPGCRGRANDRSHIPGGLGLAWPPLCAARPLSVLAVGWHCCPPAPPVLLLSLHVVSFAWDAYVAYCPALLWRAMRATPQVCLRAPAGGGGPAFGRGPPLPRAVKLAAATVLGEAQRARGLAFYVRGAALFL